MRMSAEFLPDWRTCGISINSNAASCRPRLKSLYRSKSQYAFLTTMWPLSSNRSRTFSMSKLGKLASRAPSAMFSRSRNTAIVVSLVLLVIGYAHSVAPNQSGAAQVQRHEDAVDIRNVSAKWPALHKAVAAIQRAGGQKIIPGSGLETQAAHAVRARGAD